MTQRMGHATPFMGGALLPGRLSQAEDLRVRIGGMTTSRSERSAARRIATRLATWIGCGLLLLIIVIPGWILIGSGDLEEAGDGDLLSESMSQRDGGLARRVLARAGDPKNALDNKRIAAALTAFKAGDFSDALWISEEARRWSELREGMLTAGAAEIEEGSSAVTPSQEHVDDGYLGVQGLARLSAASALYLSREGNLNDAVDEVLFGLHAGRRIAEAPDVDLIGMMVAQASVGIGLSALEEIARQQPISPELSRRLTSEIEESLASREDWRRMWANEYRNTLEMLTEALSPDSVEMSMEADSGWKARLYRAFPNDYLVQRNRTYARFAQGYRARRETTGSDCLRVYSQNEASKSPPSMFKILAQPNPVGELIFAISEPNFERFELKRCASEANAALVAVVIATKAFGAQEEGLPASLELLVPEYLAVMPVSPYDRRPIEYSLAERTVRINREALVARLGPRRSSPFGDGVDVRELDFESTVE